MKVIVRIGVYLFFIISIYQVASFFWDPAACYSIFLRYPIVTVQLINSLSL